MPLVPLPPGFNMNQAALLPAIYVDMGVWHPCGDAWRVSCVSCGEEAYTCNHVPQDVPGVCWDCIEDEAPGFMEALGLPPGGCAG